MTLVFVPRNTPVRVPTALFIPFNAINRFDSFTPEGEYTEGYIFETLLALISYRLAHHLPIHRVLGIQMERTKTAPEPGLINVRTHITIAHWVAFMRGNVSMLPPPVDGNNVDRGLLPNDSIFPGSRTLEYSDTTPNPGILVDSSELRNYGMTNPLLEYWKDRRQLIATLLYLISEKANNSTDTQMNSVNDIGRFNHGIAQVIRVVFSTVSNRVGINEQEFNNSSFLKMGVLWTQKFAGDESHPQQIRILNQ